MSTLRFSQAALSAALATVARVRPWQHDIKKSALIRAIVADGTCILTSSNLDMQIEVACEADGAADEFALPLDAFAAFVGKTPAGSRIDLACSSGSTLVTSGRSRCTLQASLRDAAPLRQAAEGSQFSMPAATLAACLEAAVPATGDDKAQPHLGGVNIRDGAGGIMFAAQDGNRLHIAAQDGNRCDASVVIPWRAVDAILSVLPREGDASITVDSYRVTIVSGGVSVTSSLLGGSYPPVDARAAPLTDRELCARADDLLSAIALIMTVANERDRDFRFDLGADCQASAFRQNGDAGAVGFNAAYQGAPLAIGFQFDPVRDALALFGAHAIRWRMGGPEDPTIITCDARPGVQAVLSPYRLVAEHLRSAA